MSDRTYTYLIDRNSGAAVRSYISILSLRAAIRMKGWNFDWKREFKASRTVYKLSLMDYEIQGLISIEINTANKAIYIPLVESAPHNIGSSGRFKGVGKQLFAYAGKLANEQGYDFIYFDAKTGLIDYYHKELGAYATGFGGRMILEGNALKELVDNYFGGGARQ